MRSSADIAQITAKSPVAAPRVEKPRICKKCRTESGGASRLCAGCGGLDRGEAIQGELKLPRFADTLDRDSRAHAERGTVRKCREASACHSRALHRRNALTTSGPGWR